jgi:hypothetical protein
VSNKAIIGERKKRKQEGKRDGIFRKGMAHLLGKKMPTKLMREKPF